MAIAEIFGVIGFAALLGVAYKALHKTKKTGSYASSIRSGVWAELKVGASVGGVTVAISNNFSVTERDNVVEGLNAWTKASSNLVHYTLDKPDANADIVITTGTLGPNQGGWTHIVRDGGEQPKTGMMTGAVITLDTKQVKESNLAKVASHEFGHALGIVDHAPKDYDSCMQEGGAGFPAKADVATLKEIYQWR